MRHRLQTRIEVWTDRLAAVDHALQGELEKEYYLRTMDYLLFLDREKRICNNVISELSALAKETDSDSYLETVGIEHAASVPPAQREAILLEESG